ncbi:uncharacterized protein LOC141608554 [Silene latifolia]|uniref:uncharacterized protein LOC141608554 n=1 Tax=Silene latifolia TaxID=37657 RepID=UPI003D77C6F7
MSHQPLGLNVQFTQILEVNSYMEFNHVRPEKRICTIKEINKTAEPGAYKAVATIVGLDTSFKWYYMSCKFCERKASLGDDNFWKCSKANCSVFNQPMRTDNVIPRSDTILRDTINTQILVSDGHFWSYLSDG